jgi:hypothetical protein
VTTYAKEVLSAVESGCDIQAMFDNYVRDVDEGRPSGFLPADLYLQLERDREKEQGRNEAMQVRNKLLFDSLNEEIFRVVSQPAFVARGSKPPAPSFVRARRMKPSVNWSDMKAKLLAFVAGSSKGCTSQLNPMSSMQRGAKIDALIRADVR